jgi:hypothetical protein
VLEEGHAELFTVFHIGLLRILQFAAERGHGDKLLDWLKSSGFSDRYWPLYVAFDAYLHGEGRLMDVNPEVRSGARCLLAEMTRGALALRSPGRSGRSLFEGFPAAPAGAWGKGDLWFPGLASRANDDRPLAGLAATCRGAFVRPLVRLWAHPARMAST